MALIYSLCPTCGSSTVRWIEASRAEEDRPGHFRCENCLTTWVVQEVESAADGPHVERMPVPASPDDRRSA